MSLAGIIFAARPCIVNHEIELQRCVAIHDCSVCLSRDDSKKVVSLRREKDKRFSIRSKVGWFLPINPNFPSDQSVCARNYAKVFDLQMPFQNGGVGSSIWSWDWLSVYEFYVHNLNIAKADIGTVRRLVSFLSSFYQRAGLQVRPDPREHSKERDTSETQLNPVIRTQTFPEPLFICGVFWFAIIWGSSSNGSRC